MGVLDDAIREHLDLKRKHGAPEQEVQEQEQEVLGPPSAPAAPEPIVDAGPAAEEVAEEPGADAEPVAAEPEAEIQPEPEPEPEPRRGDTPPRGFEPVEEPPPADGDDDEDVLEETPDFLQETPEHDRLWFEQKPPRDFDFDEE